LNFRAVEIVTGEEGVSGLTAPVGFSNHDTVSNEDALEGKRLSVNDLVNVVEDLVGQEGDVHAAVGLA
jgi:hypothetical protein